MTVPETFQPRHPETITVVSEGIVGQDDLGNDVAGETLAVVPGCAIYPRTAVTDRGAQVVAGLTVLAPWGTEINPHAKVRARGATWDVDGVPGEWRSSITGNTGAVEIALKATTG